MWSCLCGRTAVWSCMCARKYNSIQKISIAPKSSEHRAQQCTNTKLSDSNVRNDVAIQYNTIQ